MSVSSVIEEELSIQHDIFLDQDDQAIQTTLASVLREKAINHLRNSDDVVAQSFRGEYIQSGLGHPEAFLAEQAEDGKWGTYLEAEALARRW